MTNFEKIKSMTKEELLDWLDEHGEFDGSPWMEWFNQKYCQKCDPVIIKIIMPDTKEARESEETYCETHNDVCRFFNKEMDVKEIIGLWLDQEEK